MPPKIDGRCRSWKPPLYLTGGTAPQRNPEIFFDLVSRRADGPGGRPDDPVDWSVDVEAVVRCKGGIGERLQRIGASVEAMYPALRRGDGARLLIRSYALMLGLWQLTAPSPAREQLLARNELAVFRLDYLVQLEAALFALWRGTVDA